MKRKKHGLIFSLSIGMGTMIGAGTFFKNASIANATGSPWLTILTWVIGGIGILATAIALIEITSNKTIGNGGIVDWAKLFINKRFSKMTVWFISMLYIPLTWMPFGFYAAYYTWGVFGVDPVSVPWYLTMFLTLFYVLWVGIMNSFWLKPGHLFQVYTMAMKLIPLILVIIIGLLTKEAFDHGVLSSHPTHTHFGGNASHHKFSKILLELPAVLFAFDGFYYVANIKDDMKNPKKTLSLAIVLSIVLTILFYSLLSVAVFTYSNGNVLEFFKNAFPHELWISKIIQATLVIAVLNALNGFVISNTKLVEYSSDKGLLPLQKILSKRSEKKMIPIGSCLFLTFISLASTLLAFLIGHFYYSNTGDYDPSKYTNAYAFIDLLSNWSSVIIMLIIAIIIWGALYNRISNKIEVVKNSLFVTTAIIGAVFLTVIPICNVIIYIIRAVGEGPGSSDAVYLYVLLLYIAFSFIGMLPIYKKYNDISKKRIED